MSISGSSLTNALGSVPVVGDVLSTIGGVIKGLTGGRSQAQLRAADNDMAYKQAIAGNRAGFEFLAGKSGAVLPSTLSNTIKLNSTKPWAAGSVLRAPWDDAVSKADAFAKYNAVLAAASQGGGGAAQAAGPDPGSIGDAVAKGKVALAGIPSWAVFAGVAAIGFALVKMEKR